MNKLDISKVGIVMGHAFLGWALCAATMGLGMALVSEETAIIIHAIAAPIFFAGIAWVYFTRFHYTAPLQTALIFVGFVMFVDFFLVALVLLGSLDMFANLLGTWIPFALIFISTYGTGWLIVPKSERSLATQP